VTQCRIVFTDISWRKEAEELLREQETHLEAILEAAADGILAVDTKGKVRRANRRFAEIWRIPESIMKSGDDEILLGFVLNELSDPDGFLKKVQVLYDSDAESFDTFAFKDGRVIERYSFAMIMGGVRIGRVWSFRDVTERKALEASLTEALLHANASDAAKSEFLSVMSHELRSPLNGIIGFAELLENTALDAEQKSFVQTITKSGSHVLAVVNDVLDFSSMEAGALPIHVAPLELAELLEHSVAAAQKTAGDKGVAFRCDVAGDVPKQIVGDERRIRQILINLLGNAVKFTARGSVVLRVATDAERRFLNFSVEDTGIGISPESLGHLFNAFTQADSTINRQFGGSGLGLAISKRLAEAMGGTLTAESLPDKGSTFRVRLPLEIPTGMADAPSKGRFRV
jgi:signal transduction histidine kinase